MVHYSSGRFIIVGLLDSQELKQYPGLRAEVGNAAIDSLDRMKEESKRATLQLVDMECSYLTVEFFRKLPQDIEKGGNPTHSIFDRYNDSYLRRIGKFSRLCWQLCLHLAFILFLFLLADLMHLSKSYTEIVQIEKFA